jgi:PAS domain S-box-containing protein
MKRSIEWLTHSADVGSRPSSVLVVNDSPEHLGLIKLVLEDAGYEVLTASDGEEGIAAALSLRPDVILSDVVMPRRDGFELCRLVRAAPELVSTPVLLMTALAKDADSAARGIQAGADDYLDYPHDPIRMVAKVARLVERKRGEEILRRQLDFTTALMASLGEGLIAFDGERRVVYLNPAAEATLGWETSAAANREVDDLLSIAGAGDATDTSLRSALTDALRSGVVARVEGHFGTRNGAAVPVSYSCSPIRSAGEIVGGVLTFHDVTEQRRAEEQRRAAQRLEAVGRLAGGIAHDFNNLLVAIIGYAEFAIDGLPDADPLRGDLQEIVKAGGRAAALTRQLLAFSRKQVLKPQALDANEVLRNMEGMLRRLLGEDIDFQTRYAIGPASVLADPGQMEQVIMNLAVNARDAMPTGGTLVIETSIERSTPEAAGTSEPVEYVTISVTDTGRGMDEATRAQIFEPFFSTKTVGGGTGLGLATVHGIVTQSGGRIAVRSAPARGTSFRVAFPLLDWRADNVSGAHARSLSAGAPRSTILLVEDEAAVRQVANRSLTAAGFTVLAASDPGQAFVICQEHQAKIDLLLTDVIMPGMSGRALWELVRPLRPEMQVLYMSGYSGTAISQHGVLTEGTHLIEKPFNGAALVRRVSEVLEAIPPAVGMVSAI